jgi:hypothetical protein
MIIGPFPVPQHARHAIGAAPGSLRKLATLSAA